MIELLSYIKKENILELTSGNIEENTRNLLKICLNDINDADRQDAFNMIKNNRYNKGLNLSKGFALIHLRFDKIDNIRLAIGILPKPIKTGKKDEVNAIFCIVIPDAKCRTYLSLMAYVTRLLSQPDAKDHFRPGNIEGIIEFVRQFEENRG